MHELSIANQLVNVIVSSAKENNLQRVSRARVRLSAFELISPDSLKACFEISAAGTLAANTVLEIDVIPIKGTCRKCAYSFTISDHPPILCPQCNSLDVDIGSDEGVNVEFIEGE